jgi:hypothetical protein
MHSESPVDLILSVANENLNIVAWTIPLNFRSDSSRPCNVWFCVRMEWESCWFKVRVGLDLRPGPDTVRLFWKLCVVILSAAFKRLYSSRHWSPHENPYTWVDRAHWPPPRS